MKKSVLFSVLCAASVSFASAQVVSSAMEVERNVLPSHFWSNEVVGVAKHVSKEDVKALKQLRDNVEPAYDRPDGTFKVGMTVDYDLGFPSFVGGGVREFPWRFRNRTTGADETTTYTWNLQDLVLEGDPENNNDLFLIVPQIGVATPPILTATTGTSRKTYQYGTKRDFNGEVPTQKFLMAGVNEALPLTYADYYYGRLMGPNENENNIFGSGDLGLPGGQFYSEKGGYRELGQEDDIRAKGVVTYFEKPVSPLLIKYASFLCRSASQQPLTEDTELTMEFRKLDENGRIDMESEPLITSKATYADMHQTHPLSKDMYVAKFSFTELDDFGIPVETDVLVDQAFAMLVTGFDQPGCDVGILFADYVTPKGGSTWLMLEDGTLGTYAAKDVNDEPVSVFDAYMQVVGYFPILYPLVNCGFAPKEGGLAQVLMDNGGQMQLLSPQFYSNAPGTGDEAIEIKSDVPSWINITPNETYYEEQAIIIYIVECEPLPADVPSRIADIVFAHHGIERTIRIGQGEEAISANIADQFKVVRSGNAYELSYPAGTTSVTVVNGLGQVVAQYDLPTGGSMMIPAANLSDGLNVFKFNGIGNVAIKAMK